VGADSGFLFQGAQRAAFSGATRIGGSLPDIWNSEDYRQRAVAWRERARRLTETDTTRDICIKIAADFESLARTLEERERLHEAAKPAPSLGA
jgi:hypothetical protein